MADVWKGYLMSHTCIGPIHGLNILYHINGIKIMIIQVQTCTLMFSLHSSKSHFTPNITQGTPHVWVITPTIHKKVRLDQPLREISLCIWKTPSYPWLPLKPYSLRGGAILSLWVGVVSDLIPNSRCNQQSYTSSLRAWGIGVTFSTCLLPMDDHHFGYKQKIF
jgi:hypothetical protein